MSANLAAVWIIGILVAGATISSVAHAITNRKRGGKDDAP